MRKHNNISNIISWVLTFALLLVAGYMMHTSSYDKGYNDGYKEGIEAQNQQWSDTIIEWCYTGEAAGDICEDRW